MKTRTALLVIALSLPAVVALAGPKQEAKKHIDRAMKAHAAGKFDVALSELRVAYKLDPQPDLLYALGQVYSKLGRCSDATSEFEKFRAAKKKDPQVAKVVDEAIAACHPADTPFADSSSGEKIDNDAKPEEQPDAKREPKAEEKVPSKPEAKLDESPPGSDTEQPAALTTRPPGPIESGPSPTPAAPPGPATPPTPATAPAPAAPPAPIATAPASRAWYRDVLGDALVAGGVVALVGAGVEYSGARSALDDAEKAPDLASYNSRVDDAHGQRTVAIVLGVGGVALVGGGIFRFMTHDRSETHGMAIVPTRGGGLITWGGSL